MRWASWGENYDKNFLDEFFIFQKKKKKIQNIMKML